MAASRLLMLIVGVYHWNRQPNHRNVKWMPFKCLRMPGATRAKARTARLRLLFLMNQQRNLRFVRPYGFGYNRLHAGWAGIEEPRLAAPSG